jgi:hypothetical protein
MQANKPSMGVLRPYERRGDIGVKTYFALFERHSL